MSKITCNILIIICSFFWIQCNHSTPKATEQNKVSGSSLVENDSIKTAEVANKSEITCPKCGHKKMEEMPTDVCLLTYVCENCKTVLHPKEGDCCVFCTYGTQKCPSIQEGPK